VLGEQRVALGGQRSGYGVTALLVVRPHRGLLPQGRAGCGTRDPPAGV